MSLPDPHPVDALVAAIVECASRREFEVTRDPAELSKKQTKSASISPAFGEDLEARSQIRPEMAKVVAPIGMFIKSHSPYAIHVGQLGRGLVVGEWEDDYYSELISQWHGYQQYAAIARTWLLSDFSDDMNIFLVGPAGSKDETEWQNFAQVVERNDLVCRKLLWLPGKNDHEWSNELVAFLDRTFLSEPWKGTATTSGINLDALSDTMDDFDTWRKVLERPEFRIEPIDSAALVKALLEANAE
jgi:hypothetical protein